MVKQPHLKKVRTSIAPGLTEDAEVIQTVKEDFSLVQGPIKYYMVFTQIEHIIKKAKDMPVVKLIYWLGDNLQDKQDLICLNLTIKKQIMAKLDLSLSAVEKGITELKKELLLLPFSEDRTAMYKVNPTFIWKGDLNSRHGAMKEFLEQLRISNLPDKEKKAIEARARYEKAIYMEEAEYKFDFSKVEAATGFETPTRKHKKAA